jgi:acyl carrier protein
MRALVEEVVLDGLRLANQSRPPDRQLAVGPDVPLFGEGGGLDSLGLVTLVIDIEDGLRDRGLHVDLSDAQALSERRSPFRTTGALVDYITNRLGDAG